MFPYSLQNVDILLRWFIYVNNIYSIEASWQMIVFILNAQPDSTNSSMVSSLITIVRLATALRTFIDHIDRLNNYTTAITYDKETNTFKYKATDEVHEILVIPNNPIIDWIVRTLTWSC
jgi:hypothetical protein